MKKLLSTTAIAIAFTAVGASADDHANDSGNYIETSAGIVNAWDQAIGGTASDYKNGYSLNVGFGFDWDVSDDVRPEIEVSYKANDFDNNSGDVTSYAAMGNVFYDFENESSYTPYVGLGGGVAYVEAESPNFVDDEDTVFAYQGMLGAALEVDPTVELTMEYKYFNAMDVEIANVGEDIESNNIELGIRFKY